VMGLGLPLLQTLTVSQFRAVMAHEFGHYYGGDTKLGPWVYKTRAAIVRTLLGISQHSQRPTNAIFLELRDRGEQRRSIRHPPTPP
jgi:Zn-dependent protease with chaperone function